ncbi:unnamed protein product [Cuscuta campestris]|uniref:GPI inositol-deacylase n=1 Tax=Cuscuta campestris TaxID=132261 RepID=A0A484LAQ3_9ASTE|nr:unnamed protein product [Cuscuta campestris]
MGTLRFPGLRANLKVGALIIFVSWLCLAALYNLTKPVSNGCVMTYMYPTYIPISVPENVSSTKYGLYLYHEGWKKIDFDEHLKQLTGVPVLFIPGNSGSYKQVRSIAAESERAYQGGPLEKSFYQEAFGTPGGSVHFDGRSNPLPSQYACMLDWFAVDLEGEHSAMDGRILEEHTEYVVSAIHRILDHYKNARDARVKEGASVSRSLSRSVILVGHSMGGFVARSATVHPHLRRSAVQTVLTLSTPHQSPPLALQPSLGQYYAHINNEWKKGYEVQTSRSGRYLADPLLSHVVVVSISGGYYDYQVRSQLESLDGIVPPTHGFMVSSTCMKNVWLSMEHQVILWCNQLVVQVSHTLLSLIDNETHQPFIDVHRRLAILTRMLQSAIPPNFDCMQQTQLPQQLAHISSSNGKPNYGSEGSSYACPRSTHWSDDGLERDLYIETTTVTILAMDGRRRWLDIQKLGANGKAHFVFVTNLSPCSGVRLHLWPEKGTLTSDVSVNKRIVEVTSKLINIPSGPAPRQIEPGSQTEQAPPSAILWLHPTDMHGYRFLTISVAPRQTVSGRPPPATSMGVGQFFNLEEGKIELSPKSVIPMIYTQKDILLKEDHPLAINILFSLSLGILPVTLSVKTTGCGIQKSELSVDETGDMDISSLCKLRCFPPVALAWDASSGLTVFPNLYSEIIMVDSSPGIWSSKPGSDKTIVLLLVDPHCSYKTSFNITVTVAAGRFLLLYFSQIIGFSIAVIFFALMRQAYAWELDLPIPSLFSAVESNLRLPLPFISLGLVPILLAFLLSYLFSQPIASSIFFIIVSTICYLFANGLILVLIAISLLVFYIAATIHAFVKRRWQILEKSGRFHFFHWFMNLPCAVFSSKVARIIASNPSLVIAMVAFPLTCFVHPALGLFLLLSSHAVGCHNALSSFLLASFRSHVQTEELREFGDEEMSKSSQPIPKFNGETSKTVLPKENVSGAAENAKSYAETQLEIFHHRHGLLILHLLAMLMFLPSLVAWLQRIGAGQSFPRALDSVLSIGVLLHGICDSRPEFNFFFPFPGIPGWEIKQSLAYLLAGYVSYLSGLALAPYSTFYAMASVGVVSFAFRIIQRRTREKGEICHRSSRKHSHRQ